MNDLTGSSMDAYPEIEIIGKEGTPYTKSVARNEGVKGIYRAFDFIKKIGYDLGRRVKKIYVDIWDLRGTPYEGATGLIDLYTNLIVYNNSTLYDPVQTRLTGSHEGGHLTQKLLGLFEKIGKYVRRASKKSFWYGLYAAFLGKAYIEGGATDIGRNSNPDISIKEPINAYSAAGWEDAHRKTREEIGWKNTLDPNEEKVPYILEKVFAKHLFSQPILIF